MGVNINFLVLVYSQIYNRRYYPVKRKLIKMVSVVLTMAFVLSLFLTSSAMAEEMSYRDILTPFDKIDMIVSRDVANGFPSAQLAVMEHGHLVYSKAWGYVSLYNEYGVPLSKRERLVATPWTLYDLGGTSEIVTAWYAAFKLISDGKLEFDTKIVDVLGEDFVKETVGQEWLLGEKQTMSLELIKNWKRVLTVGDLLRGTSGFPAGPNFHKQFIMDANGNEVRNVFYNASGSRQESLQIIKMMPLEVEPGTLVRASDVDGVVLTFVVEAVTGKRLDEYLAELWYGISPKLLATFNPLENGCAESECAATEVSGNTRFGMVDFPRVRANVLRGTVHDETAYYGMEGVSGNAGLFANAESLARILTTYFDDAFFSDEVRAKIFERTDGAETSMGWYVETDESGAVTELWLNGFTRCYVGLFPENEMVVVYLTNAIHSPLAFTSEEFSEHDLTHARFAGTMYGAAKQEILFQPES